MFVSMLCDWLCSLASAGNCDNLVLTTIIKRKGVISGNGKLFHLCSTLLNYRVVFKLQKNKAKYDYVF